MDFIAGDLDVAIEVKGGGRVHDGDLRGLRALAEERRVRRRVVVSLETLPRTLGDGTNTRALTAAGPAEVAPYLYLCPRL